jgi:replicative DNA helicase
MKSTTPIHRLKRKAKLFARDAAVPLHVALDHVAAGEGYGAWSLLMARQAGGDAASAVFPLLAPGDLVLLGARPGCGKTLMALDLARQAIGRGGRAILFTLEDTEGVVVDRIRRLGARIEDLRDAFTLDCSDRIDADHVIASLADRPDGQVVIVDYLQCLDHRRDSAPLIDQIAALRRFARERGHLVLFIAQIDRAYVRSDRRCPGIADVRAPNPIDTDAFDKGFFIGDGVARLYGRSDAGWSLRLELATA